MRWCLFILITILSSAPSEAQYLFSLLQTKDGLSSNTVTSVLQDSDGFIWIGTLNGINRFDGSSIKVYNWANKNYPLYLSEGIRDMMEVEPGKFLVSTRNGITWFSSYNNKFEKVNYGPGLNSEIIDIWGMIKDPSQRIWVASGRGLFILQQDTLHDAGQIFHSLEKFQSAFTITSIAVLDTLKSGIWFGTNHGLCYINYRTGELITHEMNPMHIPAFRDDAVHTIAIQPKTGDIWWSDTKNLLIHFDAKHQVVMTHNDLFKKYSSLLAKRIFVDSKDRIWYSTWGGLCLVIDSSGIVSSLPGSVQDPYGLQSGFFEDIIEETSGDLWFATYAGAARLPHSNVIHHITEIPFDHASVNTVDRLDDEHFLITCGVGVVIYNTQQKTYELFKPVPGKSRSNILYAATPVNNEWWCAEAGGIQIFNPATKKFHQPDLYQYADELKRYSTITMKSDRKGNIWFSTWNGYTYRYEPASDHITKFDGSSPEHGDVKECNCLALEEASDGKVWLGYGENGLRIYDYTTRSFHNIPEGEKFDHNIVSHMAESKDHHMWLSCWGQGVYELDLDGNILNHITTEHGLMSNFTSGLTIDAEGRIWVGTTESIQYFYPGSSLVSKINFDLGHSQGENWVNMIEDGHYMYVAFGERILVIDRNLLDQQMETSFPIVSGFSVFEKEIPFSPLMDDVELKYNQNFFTINFSSSRHLEFPSLQYAYILEGFNPDWVNSGRNLSASFTNVPPGQYVFRVKNSDQNGVFHEGDRHFTVVIQPPFYKTTWFYILCTVAAAYFLFLLYRFIQRRREKKKSEQIIDYFANSVYSENSVNEICWDIARNCISQLGFEDCVVYLLEADRGVLIQKAAYGPLNPKGNEIINPVEITLGQGIVGMVAMEGQALLIPDATKDVRFNHGEKQYQSKLTVPILHEQKVIGVIDAEHPQKDFFTSEHLKTLSTIASISSFKIADAQASMLARESALKLMEVNTLFAESQLKALRAQMNPHFVFNCLNSIQECIVLKKYAEASSYLNKFAKLFRLVLNNSGKLLITIDEEVEILTLYLELELMRFDHSFEYTVHIDPGIESDDILMPSMFLQPFVENALWHGLMHKNGDRKIDISFHKISEDIFSCTVEDNGIGRKKSAELKKQKIFTHTYESKGMKMNIERLELLRHQGFHATLQILDIEDKEGLPQGTSVIAEFSNNFSYN